MENYTNYKEILAYLETLQIRYNPLTLDIATTALAGRYHSYAKRFEGVIKGMKKQGLIGLKNGVITLHSSYG